MWVDDARVEEIVRRIVDVARNGPDGRRQDSVVPGESYETVIDLAAPEAEAEAGDQDRAGSRSRPRR